MTATLPSIYPMDRELIEIWREHGIPVDSSTVEYAGQLIFRLLERADGFEELWLKAVGVDV